MKRGQAAMEFLSTYGWALMIVLVAIGALSYFGVTNPKNLIPERCLIGTGFSCDDFQLLSAPSTEEIKIFLSNNLGNPITIQAGSFSVITSQETIDPAGCQYRPDGGSLVDADSNPISVGSQGSFEVYCDTSINLVNREKESIDFNFTYIEVGGRYPHAVSGDIFAEVQ